MINKITSDLRNQLYYSYHFHPYNNDDSTNLLKESHGLTDIVSQMCFSFKEDFRNIISEFLNENDTIERTFEKEFIDNKFVKKVICKITIGKQYNKDKILFQYYPNQSKYNSKEKKFDSIYIEGLVESTNNNFNLSHILSFMAHELTHAYEDLMRIKNKDSILNKGDRIGYFNEKDYFFKDVKYIETLIYYTYTFEKNAFIAQLINEIKPELSDCSSSKMAWNLVRKTIFWKNIEILDDFVNSLSSNDDINYQKNLIDYWNYKTKDNITEYKFFLKKVSKRWNLFKKKLITNLSKQITDAAFENPNWRYIR